MALSYSRRSRLTCLAVRAPRSGCRNDGKSHTSLSRWKISQGTVQLHILMSKGENDMNGQNDRAVLAGGCFWGMQDLLRRYPGRSFRRASDTQGATFRTPPTAIMEPMPRRLKSSLTRRRSVTGRFWSSFFRSIDPTTLNRQGNDRGASYRSAIFYTSDEQRRVAEDTIADVEASGLWPGKVVTEVSRAGPFWEAEPEHQDSWNAYRRATPATLSGRTGYYPAATTRHRLHPQNVSKP